MYLGTNKVSNNGFHKIVKMENVQPFLFFLSKHNTQTHISYCRLSVNKLKGGNTTCLYVCRTIFHSWRLILKPLLVLTVLTKYYHTQAVVYLIDPVMYVMGCRTKQLHIRDKYVRMLL